MPAGKGKVFAGEGKKRFGIGKTYAFLGKVLGEAKNDIVGLESPRYPV